MQTCCVLRPLSLARDEITEVSPYSYTTSRDYEACDPIHLCSPKFQNLLRKIQALTKHYTLDLAALTNAVRRIYEDLFLLADVSGPKRGRS